MMIGTRLDKLHETQVRVEELRHFERLYNLPLLLIGNKIASKEQSRSSSRPQSLSSSGATPVDVDAKHSLYDMSGFLTQLCEYLLNAEQIKFLQQSSFGSQI